MTPYLLLLLLVLFGPKVRRNTSNRLLTTELTRTNVVGIEKLLSLCLRVVFLYFFSTFRWCVCKVRKSVGIVDIINDAVATKKSEFFFVIRNLISGRANPFELDGGVN